MNNDLKNFGFRHKSGILMPISSLPNKYGIGTFGKSAYDFIDFLRDTKTKCWQVLPLNPTSYGDSPYQSPAAVAGNPYFIDPDMLEREGLLTKEELQASCHDTARVDYGWLFGNRYALLRAAYARFLERGGDKTPAYRSFLKKNAEWLSDYALFMALKVHYGYAAWTDWSEEHRDINRARASAAAFEEESGFFRWVQFAFDTQWQALLAYAHKNGVMIIGDMPIYVAHDSMDVWQAPEQFLLDEKGYPTVVAGCPPDGFSPDGQLWGNPIYNWDKMEADGFVWWEKRVKAAFRLYDILRIDHFRGFAGYYNIPFGESTARGGKWDAAPGIALFRTLKERFPRAKIIAEDLGFITEDVRELLTDTGFPGMKILQFAFFDENSEFLPRTYTSDNCVVYTGSHDSDCTRTWAENLDKSTLARFHRECPRDKGQTPTMAMIEFAMRSRANLAVIPMQDWLGLTNAEGRMNVPAVADGNWNWRIRRGWRTKCLTRRVREMLEKTKRATK
jgi:4-alpha-glucanotransferase